MLQILQLIEWIVSTAKATPKAMAKCWNYKLLEYEKVLKVIL